MLNTHCLPIVTILMQVRLKVEEPLEQLDEEEVRVRLRKLKEKELSEFKVVFARDQSGGIDLARRTLDAKRGSWKPLLYSTPATNGKQKSIGAADKSIAAIVPGTRLDWGIHSDGGLGCSPGFPAVGFDLWAHWIISGVTVSTGSASRTPEFASSKQSLVRMALEAANCARAFGRDELCTRLAEFESTQDDGVIRHTLTRPVRATLNVVPHSCCSPLSAAVRAAVIT